MMRFVCFFKSPNFSNLFSEQNSTYKFFWAIQIHVNQESIAFYAHNKFESFYFIKQHFFSFLLKGVGWF